MTSCSSGWCPGRRKRHPRPQVPPPSGCRHEDRDSTLLARERRDEKHDRTHTRGRALSRFNGQEPGEIGETSNTVHSPPRSFVLLLPRPRSLSLLRAPWIDGSSQNVLWDVAWRETTCDGVSVTLCHRASHIPCGLSAPWGQPAGQRGSQITHEEKKTRDGSQIYTADSRLARVSESGTKCLHIAHWNPY